MRLVNRVLSWTFSFLALLFIVLIICYLNNQKNSISNLVVEFSDKKKYIPINEQSIIEIYNNVERNTDSVVDINISLLEELISSNAYVKQAELYLSIDGNLNILVSLKTPAFRLIEGENVIYTDYEGSILPKLKGVDEKLIVLTGDLDIKNDTNLIYILDQIDENENLQSLVGGIHFDIKRGYIISLFDCSVDVYLGLKPVLDLKKINMLVAFYNFLLTESNCTYCSGINLEYDNQIICIK